jgi:hypothetical protein
MLSVAAVAAQAPPTAAGRPAAGGGEAAVRRDAREIGSDLLIGTWAVNVEKSRFNGPPPKSDVRTFDYTSDGKVLHTRTGVNAQGNRSFSHWIARLDGSEGVEYNRTAGSTPITVVNMKLTDPRTLTISASRNGEVIWLGSFAIAQDGKTMNWKLKSTPALGRQTEFDWVYEKQ